MLLAFPDADDATTKSGLSSADLSEIDELAKDISHSKGIYREVLKLFSSLWILVLVLTMWNVQITEEFEKFCFFTFYITIITFYL